METVNASGRSGQASGAGHDLVINSLLEQVQKIIRESIDTREKLLREMALYFISSQGKLLRPLLVLLCGLISGKAGDPAPKELCIAASGVEMLHMSALVHDDIIDKASVRRGRPSINAAYGNDMALLLGDYFYSKSLRLLSRISMRDVVDKALDVIARMTEGEVKQKKEVFDVTAGVKDYMIKITRKTASLTALSCFTGGRVANLPEKEVKRLAKFGEYFGRAYQIRDDILDFLKNEQMLKKPAADLDQGIFTLPMILYLRDKSHMPDDSTISKDQLESLYDRCARSGAVSRSAMLCNAYLDKSARIMETFPDSVIRLKIFDILQRAYF